MSQPKSTDQPNDQILPMTDEAIAKRAYEIWEAKGCPVDDGSDNWEAARAQLLAEAYRPPSDVAQQRRGPLLRLFDRIRNRAAL